MNVFGQSFPDSLVVRLDTIDHSFDLEKHTLVFIDSVLNVPVKNIFSQQFVPLETLSFKKGIPPHLVLKPVYLQFVLENISPGPIPFYFYPGMHYRETSLYLKSMNGGLEKIPLKHRSGFIFLTLPAGKKITYLLKLEFSRTEYNRIASRIINPQYLSSFKLELANTIHDKTTVGFIFSGILLIMILFTLVNYFITGRMEFFYNCLYSLCMFLIVFLYSYLNNDPRWLNGFLLSYLDLFLLIAGTIFYIQFTRKFLDTKINHPGLDRLFKTEIWLLSILMVIYSLVHYLTDHFEYEYLLENTMKIIAMAIGLIYIFIGMANRDRLMNYLAIGNAVQIQFSGISLIFILLNVKSTSIFNTAIFYFEVGVVVSVFFFILGLAYKNRQELIGRVKEGEAMKLLAEKQHFETQIAVIHAQQAERNRISADMHDDLGAGMTTIRLYSELAKNKMGDHKIPEIEKISASADELLIKMNAIIWSMTSSNDSLGNMVAYIRSYALEYFENTGITCNIFIPDRLPDIEVSGQIRRNIFLVVKEALNNIVKHSNASLVKITLLKEQQGLCLLINDNGKGIDFEKTRPFGNGLKNMKKRMEDIGVEFSIENHNGTTIRLYRRTRN